MAYLTDDNAVYANDDVGSNNFLTFRNTDISSLLQTSSLYLQCTTAIRIRTGAPITCNTAACDGNSLTLEAQDASVLIESAIDIKGAFTAKAGTFITVKDHITTHAQIQLLADSTDDGDGAFTITADKNIVSNNNAISISGSDMDIAGTIDSGTGPLTISPTNGRQLGLGNTARAMHITDDELGKVSSSSITIGSSTAGAMLVDQITDHAHVGPILLVATHPSGAVEFKRKNS